MRYLFITLIFLSHVLLNAQTIYVNPEGSYSLVSKNRKVKGETYGRFGTINVKRISDNQIYFELDINSGAASYNNGFAGGTWEYNNNQVVYSTEFDATCFITMTFSKKGITVVQKADDINMACGFGHAVYADGFYKRTSLNPVFSER